MNVNSFGYWNECVCVLR